MYVTTRKKSKCQGINQNSSDLTLICNSFTLALNGINSRFTSCILYTSEKHNSQYTSCILYPNVIKFIITSKTWSLRTSAEKTSQRQSFVSWYCFHLINLRARVQNSFIFLVLQHLMLHASLLDLVHSRYQDETSLRK